MLIFSSIDDPRNDQQFNKSTNHCVKINHDICHCNMFGRRETLPAIDALRTPQEPEQPDDSHSSRESYRCARESETINTAEAVMQDKHSRWLHARSTRIRTSILYSDSETSDDEVEDFLCVTTTRYRLSGVQNQRKLSVRQSKDARKAPKEVSESEGPRRARVESQCLAGPSTCYRSGITSKEPNEPSTVHGQIIGQNASARRSARRCRRQQHDCVSVLKDVFVPVLPWSMSSSQSDDDGAA